MILVTGGTGTLGRELVRRLVEKGECVRVLTRDRGRASVLPSAVEVLEGDLDDDVSVAAAVRGCTAVISAAHGFVGPGKPTPERVDREGNRRLIRAAAAAEVDRFILVSVVGASRDHPMSLSRAKFAAEQELRGSGLKFAVVRAAPFLETWVGIQADMLHTNGHVIVFGPGTNPVSFVSVRDVAALVVAALGEESNDVYEIGGPEAIGLAAVAEEVLAARGGTAKIRHVPLFALRLMSVAARPFSPAFARQAQAAVLMNTTDMTVAATWRARHPSIPVTSLAEVVHAAGRERH